MSSSSLISSVNSQALVPQLSHRLSHRYPPKSWFNELSISVTYSLPSSGATHSTKQTLTANIPVPPSEMTQEDYENALEKFRQRMLQDLSQDELQRVSQSLNLSELKQNFKDQLDEVKNIEAKGMNQFLLDRCQKVADNIFNNTEEVPHIHSLDLEVKYVTAENRGCVITDCLHIDPKIEGHITG